MFFRRWSDSNQVKTKFYEFLGEIKIISMEDMSEDFDLLLLLMTVRRDRLSLLHQVVLVPDLMF